MHCFKLERLEQTKMIELMQVIWLFLHESYAGNATINFMHKSCNYMQFIFSLPACMHACRQKKSCITSLAYK